MGLAGQQRHASDWNHQRSAALSAALLTLSFCLASSACAVPEASMIEPAPSSSQSATDTRDPACVECSELHAGQRAAIALRATPSPSPTNTPNVSLEQLRWAKANHQPALLLFTDDRCDSCRAMSELLRSASVDSRQVLLLEVRVDEPAGADLARELHVDSLPAWYLLTRDGVGTVRTGALSQEQLTAELTRLQP